MGSGAKEKETLLTFEESFLMSSSCLRVLCAGLVVQFAAHADGGIVRTPLAGGNFPIAGMQAGYTRFFGTKEQPNLPVRTTVQVASLAGPGLLVEIDAIAARSH
jgi:hypothetical protein